MDKSISEKFANDWRVETYDNELDGQTFEYQKFVTEGSNDHEHCVFCWQKITDLDIPDADEYGYCATEVDPQHGRWVCQKCFNDFAEIFGFRLKPDNNDR